MRDFTLVLGPNDDVGELIFSDGIAQAAPPDQSVGAAVFYDPDPHTEFPFSVLVHGAVTHLSREEARELSGAIREALDA